MTTRMNQHGEFLVDESQYPQPLKLNYSVTDFFPKKEAVSFPKRKAVKFGVRKCKECGSDFITKRKDQKFLLQEVLHEMA